MSRCRTPDAFRIHSGIEDAVYLDAELEAREVFSRDALQLDPITYQERATAYAYDGSRYSWEQFQEHYGSSGAAMWAIATQVTVGDPVAAGVAELDMRQTPIRSYYGSSGAAMWAIATQFTSGDPVAATIAEPDMRQTPTR